MSTQLDAAQADHYRNLGVQNTYVFASGAFVLPLAEEAPTNPSELQTWVPFTVVQAHAPYRLRQYQYTAAKDRNPPVLPAPESQGAYTFLGGVLSLPHPSVQTDGSFRWEGVVNYMFAEGCRSDSTVGFVIGNTLDALVNQVDNANYQNASDAPPNITEGGVGPKAGWAIGKQIDLNSAGWVYPEPSYYPAQLLSTEMICGPTVYPDLALTVTPAIPTQSVYTVADFGGGGDF
jgi:hypothetical protein